MGPLQLITASLILLTTKSTAQNGINTLHKFMEWNEVPTEVNLGLFDDPENVRTVRLVNGTCFLYDLTDIPRCQFYSDCCAMSPPRPREQLATNTFSCHNGFYVVDKCPASTEDKDLKNKCENTDGLSGE